MVRGTWLLVGLPLLVAAFSVARPAPLPAPQLPPSFDGAAASSLARELAGTFPDRSPGSAGSRRAARWVEQRLRLYGFRPRSQGFEHRVAGRGSVPLTNLSAEAPGSSGDAIVVTAHRDNAGIAPGANDNASGTAVLLELARAYARVPAGGGVGQSVEPSHTLVFLSTDGGSLGGTGAARFADDPTYRNRMVAVLNVVAVGGAGRLRLAFAGDEPRFAPSTLVGTAAARVLEQTGEAPERPSGLSQLIDLAFPFNPWEHGPFLARGTPALTLTSSGERPPPAAGDSLADLNDERLAEAGRAAQTLLGSLDVGLAATPPAEPFVFVGSRFVRGWALQLVLVAALLPFLAAAVDLFARCRRRHIPLLPAVRSYGRRLGFWLLLGALVWLFALAGAWPEGGAVPLALDSNGAGDWATGPLVGLAVIAALLWLAARVRLLPRGSVGTGDELAGFTVVLLVLGLLSLVIVAVNPFALLLLLPSLHAWLWLPQVRGRPAWARVSVLALGLIGPALLLVSFAVRFGLGLDAPWYMLTLFVGGHTPAIATLVVLAWLAAAAQAAALVSRRYAPYPERGERGRPELAAAFLHARELTARRRVPPPEEAERAVQ